MIIFERRGAKIFGCEPQKLAFRKYMKKPIPINAVQIDEDFEVATIEGVMSGKAGDYLIRGIEGELYPCKKEIFEKSYARVK